MADAEYKALERDLYSSYDPENEAAVLNQRLLRGLISRERVSLAAAFSHPASLSLLPDTPTIENLNDLEAAFQTFDRSIALQAGIILVDLITTAFDLRERYSSEYTKNLLADLSPEAPHWELELEIDSARAALQSSQVFPEVDNPLAGGFEYRCDYIVRLFKAARFAEERTSSFILGALFNSIIAIAIADHDDIHNHASQVDSYFIEDEDDPDEDEVEIDEEYDTDWGLEDDDEQEKPIDPMALIREIEELENELLPGIDGDLVASRDKYVSKATEHVTRALREKLPPFILA